MNRNKSIGVTRSRINNNHRGDEINQYQNQGQNRRSDLMRMDDFDSMFQDFGLPRFGGGFDNFFQGFGDVRSRFDNIESTL
jgi:hypothetical protein